MTTSTGTELQAAPAFGAGPRLSGGRRPDGEAIVVLAVGGAELARWPLAGSAHPDPAVVDRLARLALTARRHGAAVHLRNAGPELLGLIEFVGLDDVLAAAGPSA
ncbi:MAG TPA: hypothetical protein VFE55_21120 [Acidimicrobiia bacterium]|nr:hypothetical protein [Acidimicrobiia bacterium]